MPIVASEALRKAGTVVCEPVALLRIEAPVARMGGVLSALAGLGAAVDAPLMRQDVAVLETSFGGYQPVAGPVPRR